MIVDRKNLKSKIGRLQAFDCDVSDRQNDEMMQLVTLVSKNDSKVITELIEEGDRQLGENNLLNEAWQQDVVERLKFDSDQQKTG